MPLEIIASSQNHHTLPQNTAAEGQGKYFFYFLSNLLFEIEEILTSQKRLLSLSQKYNEYLQRNTDTIFQNTQL